MNFSDKEAVEKLVIGCTNGDQRCQQIVYKAFYCKMLGVCARYSCNREEAKDLLHDSFIKVFEKLKNFKNEGSLEGWVRRIVVNNAIDFVRAKREFLLNYDDESQFENIPDDSYYVSDIDDLNKLNAEIILKFVQKLSPAYKTVFNMYVIENYTHQEIADYLEISVGSSKSNLAKAKIRLREMFEKYKNEKRKLS
ncbi:MAG: hypothetical protein A2046_12245 [Bacteroidetes bacterium GWA2_30_7]|nr:MAG: hypothetical protein A2046_12245 [Bacteroidetes bacterium GWA2_30_7]